MCIELLVMHKEERFTHVIRSVCLSVLKSIAKIAHRRVLKRVPELVDEGICQVCTHFRFGWQTCDKLPDMVNKAPISGQFHGDLPE